MAFSIGNFIGMFRNWWLFGSLQLAKGYFYKPGIDFSPTPKVTDSLACCYDSSSKKNFFNDFLSVKEMVTDQNFDRAVFLLGLAVHGLNAKDMKQAGKNCKNDYFSFILDRNGDPKGNTYCMDRASGCGLTILGLWRALGVSDKEGTRIWGKYTPGTVQTTILNIGKKQAKSAYTHVSEIKTADDINKIFQIGNVICVDNPTHWFMISTIPVMNPYVSTVKKITYDFYAINGGGSFGENNPPPPQGCKDTSTQKRNFGLQIVKNAKMSATVTLVDNPTINNPLERKVTGVTFSKKNHGSWTRNLKYFVETKKLTRNKNGHFPLSPNVPFIVPGGTLDFSDLINIISVLPGTSWLKNKC